MSTALARAAQPSRQRTALLPPIGWVGAVIVAAFAVIAVAGSRLSPYRPAQLAGRPLEVPSGSFLLGTNSVGQDLLSQVVSGARVSLTVALLAGGGTILIGGLVGIVAGWLGGTPDAIIMRVVDFILITPRLPLLIVVGAYIGPSLPVIAAIIALTFWPGPARVVQIGRAHV